MDVLAELVSGACAGSTRPHQGPEFCCSCWAARAARNSTPRLGHWAQSCAVAEDTAST